MIEIFQFLISIAVAAAAGGLPPGIRVKFGRDANPTAGENYFFKIPTTVAEAKDQSWSLTRRPPGPIPQLVMYCPPGNAVCVLYDDTEYVAGMQVALGKSETESVFDWRTRGFSSWNTSVGGQSKDFWTTQVYYVDEQFLSKSKKDRLMNRDPSRILQTGGLWVTGFNGNLQRVSANEADIVRDKQFLKQACMPWMGQHYFYNMSTRTECVSDQIHSWSLITTKGELVATGFIMFGKIKFLEGERQWFEIPSLEISRAIVPYRSQCMYQLIKDPGSISLHIYLVDEPWNISC